MWVRKLRSLPWRVIMLAILLNTFLLAIWWLGYSTGHDRASADGQAALSRLQADFDGYRAEQARREVAALRAWSERYQEQVAAGQRAEAGYLEQIAQLEDQNKQLQGQINDVTQRWIDEKGKSHPIECVFTRGFVRQYNAALGYDNASVDTVIQTQLPPLAPALAQRPGNLKPLTPGYAIRVSPSLTSLPTSSTTQGNVVAGETR